MENTLVLEEYCKKKSRSKSLFRKYGVAILFLLPFLLAFIIFFLYPLFYGIYISMTNFTYGAPGKETFNNFKWYAKIFDPTSTPALFEAFWRSFLHTFIFAILMVPVAVITPLALAILVNVKPPLYKLFRALIYLPSIVPLTAAGTIFVLIFLPAQTNGLLATLFPGFGPTEWFLDEMLSFSINGFKVNIPYAWICIFVMCFWGGWGGNFIILSAGLQNVPKSLYEASSIDGCSKWKRITNVTLPGIKGQLVLCLFTTIIGYLGLYGQNYVLVGGGPYSGSYQSMPGGGETSTIIYFIQDIVANKPDFKTSLYGLGAAASIIFAIFVGICTGIQMYTTRTKKTGNKISEAYLKWSKIQ